VNKPGTTGRDFYQKVQESLPDLAKRIVMITGGGHEAPTREFIEKAEAPVLEKPLDMHQVRALLAGMLSRRSAA
jgi:hypothetical protein